MKGTVCAISHPIHDRQDNQWNEGLGEMINAHAVPNCGLLYLRSTNYKNIFLAMKKILILAAVALFIGCTSNSEQKGMNNNGRIDSLNADLNTAKTQTIFDSVPMEKLPYCDSISLADNSPVRKIKLNGTQLAFLKIRSIREFNEYYATEPDQAFTLVGRLPVSEEYFSVIVNFSNDHESANYLINYDREYRVVDYIQTAFAENMETGLRTSAAIDTAALTISTNNIMNEPSAQHSYKYSINTDGFFREEPGVVASK